LNRCKYKVLKRFDIPHFEICILKKEDKNEKKELEYIRKKKIYIFAPSLEKRQ